MAAVTAAVLALKCRAVEEALPSPIWAEDPEEVPAAVRLVVPAVAWISADFSDPPVPSHTYHNDTTTLPAVSLLRSSDRICLYLRFRRSRSSLRCLPASEIRIPNRIFRLLLRRIYTSSFLQAPSSAPASLNHTPDRIFLAPLFRRNRSMYHPVAVPALPAVELPAVAVLPAAAAVPLQTGSGHSCRPFRQHSLPFPFP